MSYLALYRKYRPKTFDKIIGQDHIVKTLVNQIKTDKICHAYLFSGSRGTGKTSCARVLAAAVNCLKPVNSSPCGECEVCKSLTNPTNFDVLEIDAASNNKVEEIRDLRETVSFMPVSARYKVYIIDEVHMLTDSAFNALLKTLEEPPRHVVFILCTTEPHKLPATILSRCLRFDFKLVSVENLTKLIKDIYNDVNKKYDEDAVIKIAKAGEGSVRDALSVADACYSYSDGKLTLNDVLTVLGSVSEEAVLKLIENILSGNTGECLKTVEEVCFNGKSVAVLANDIVSKLREMIIIKTCGNAKDILLLPPDNFAALKKLCNVETSLLIRLLEIFSSMDGLLRYAQYPRVVFETEMLKAAQIECDANILSVMARLAKLEQITNYKLQITNDESRSGAAADDKCQDNVPPISHITSPISHREEDEPPPAECNNNYELRITNYELNSHPSGETVPKTTSDSSAHAPRLALNATPVAPAALWGSLLKLLRERKLHAVYVCAREQKAVFENDTLTINCNEESDVLILTREDNKKHILEALSAFGNYQLRIVHKKTQDNFEEDIIKLKNIFGDETVKVTDK